MAYTLEKIDAENFKLIESKSSSTVFNVNELNKLKMQFENTHTKINSELDRVNTILDEYAKLT